MEHGIKHVKTGLFVNILYSFTSVGQIYINKIKGRYNAQCIKTIKALSADVQPSFKITWQLLTA